MTRAYARSIMEAKWTFIILYVLATSILIVMIPCYAELPIPQSVKAGFIIFMLGTIVFAQVIILRVYRAWRLIRNRKLRRRNKVWKNL
jgi:DMSO/TMAO reductase YedYZ heme-binding membrane subunit